MSDVRFGCQFYTWQMSGDRYAGRLPHILGVAREAGYAGIEPEVCMTGSYYDDSSALKEVLDEHGLELGAVCLVCDWRGAVETEEEKREAERVVDYLAHFPGTHLVLCQMPGSDRAELAQRQQNALACVNAVASRAADGGLAVSFHPNSPPGSVFRTEEDYRKLLDGLRTGVLGFAPDTGHIARGGMDVIRIFETYRPLIRHVHFKDISRAGEWAAMGEGVLDHPRITRFLRDTGFSGWVMIEEESKAAESDPDAAARRNGRYLRETLAAAAGLAGEMPADGGRG